MQRPLRVLWVTDEIPDRRLGGGSIRQSHLFEALASVYRTDLVVVGHVRDEHVRAAAASVVELPKRSGLWSEHPLGRRLLELGIMLGSRYPSYAYLARPARRTLQRAIRGHAGSYDLVCVEHAALAPLRRAIGAARTVITFHHLFSGMARQELEIAPGARQRWYRSVDLRKAEQLERQALRKYDEVVVCSDEDAAVFGGAAPLNRSKLSVVPNGVDLSAFTVTALPAEPRVLFPATLGYAPNVDGALWFCAEIWPRIKAAVPGATLALVGREPVSEVLALAQLEGVAVHADVPSMTPYYEAARAVVVPLRSGTGTRLKALEAMACGRPVVGTTIGLEGIGVANREQLLIADRPDTFADAVIELLGDAELASRLAHAGRAHVEQRFGWDRIGRDYIALVTRVLERGGGDPGTVITRSASGT
jgi:glycosyltransferase involved in cell wall biosynthesis